MSYVVYCANVDVVDAIPHELFQEVLVKLWSNNTSLLHGHEGFCAQSYSAGQAPERLTQFGIKQKQRSYY